MKTSKGKNTASKEDYLEVIYNFTSNNQPFKAVDIAKKLKISRASVSEALQKLSEQGFVQYEKYKPAKLTPKGEKLAKEVYEKHETLFVFLKQILNLTEEDAEISHVYGKGVYTPHTQTEKGYIKQLHIYHGTQKLLTIDNLHKILNINKYGECLYQTISENHKLSLYNWIIEDSNQLIAKDLEYNANLHYYGLNFEKIKEIQFDFFENDNLCFYFYRKECDSYYIIMELKYCQINLKTT